MEWKCESGTFSGYETENCIHIRGIRYAISERYGKPESYVYDEGVHECNKPAPCGIQLHSKNENFVMGIEFEKEEQEENCQYLSITMPKDVKSDSKLPVMVFIHGGSYRNGGCDIKFYNREPMVKEQHVISIGINYRLGVFGFLRDKDGKMANNGLLDIIEGLKWIKKNISSFGGDPDNITIYGQSAGGDAVRCVMLSEGTEDLYRRAIIQSDPIGTMNNREDMENKMLEELNQLPIDATIQQLKECQASIASHVTEKGNPKHMIFAPHFGIYPLPKSEDIPQRIQEIAPTHDLFIGNTAREISLFIGSNKLIGGLDGFFLTGWAIESVIKKIGNTIYHNPTDIFAKQYAEAGGKTYRYLFSWGEKISFVGASHMSDTVLLFGGSEVVGRDMSMGLSEEELYEQGKPLREIWANFAKTGHLEELKVDGLIEIHKL